MSDNEIAAILRNWMLVVVGAKMRLVGVVDGGAPLPDVQWIITDPLRDFDPVAGVATASSSGCRFDLHDSWQAEPPSEATDVIAKAIETWRASPDAVIHGNIAAVPDGPERLGVPGSQ